MQLRLNRSHPLCQSSRSLLFASFGTGAGGQVLDLSERPSHGVITDNSGGRSVGRSLQSHRPPGFPADWQPLTFRSTTAITRAEFGDVAKVTKVVSGFTAAVWVRPYWTGSELFVPFGTGTEITSGWLIVGLSGGNWQFNRYKPDVVLTITDVTFPRYQWALLVVTFVAGEIGGPKLYTNGVLSANSFNNNLEPPVEATALNIGTYTNVPGGVSYPPNADIGPCLFWGSVLSADDIALLYRDTWGMVTRPSPLALRMAAASPVADSGSSGLRRKIPFATRWPRGMFQSTGGF